MFEKIIINAYNELKVCCAYINYDYIYHLFLNKTKNKRIHARII